MQDVLDKLCVMLQVDLDDHSDFSDLDVFDSVRKLIYQ